MVCAEKESESSAQPSAAREEDGEGGVCVTAKTTLKMTICRPILFLPWCSTSKVHLRSIFVTTEGRGLFTSALFWRIFGQIGPYCTTLPSVTPSTLPPKQNMHGGCPKSHALCPIFELDALVGTSMLLLNWQPEFGRDKRCSGSSKSTHGQNH